MTLHDYASRIRQVREKMAEKALEMLHLFAGGEDAWRERPFVSNSNCFVVPPMKFATESCLVMERVIAGGMPVLLLSAGMAGATAPSTVAGAIVQAVAECLAGVVYVNAMAPGHPAVFGTWPFVSSSGTPLTSGAIAQCLGTSEPEIAVAAMNWTVHMVYYDGHEHSNYPKNTSLGWYVYGAPLIGRVDGSSSDVVVGDRGDLAWSWSNIGALVPGWPKAFTSKINVSPAMGDIDQDGSLDYLDPNDYDGPVADADGSSLLLPLDEEAGR